MRYWIWWNDLIQGPFELDELVSLRVFSEDLLVCMEDREDWLPAGRLADLSAAVEEQKIARAAPVAPPPPAPNRPPAATPLQGEFFAEAPGQQALLQSDDEPQGPFAYRPVAAEPDSPVTYFLGQATMPFHFSQSPAHVTGVLKTLAPHVEKKSLFSRIAHTESPVRDVKPAPQEKIVHKPPVALNLLQDDLLESVPEAAQAAIPEDLPAGRPVLPSLTSPYEDQPVLGRKLEILPWIVGVALALGLLTLGGYWFMHKVSSPPTLTQSIRPEPALPAPTADIRPPVKKASYMSLFRKKARVARRALKNAVHAGKVSTVKGIRSAITPLINVFSAFMGRFNAPSGHPSVNVVPPALSRVDDTPVLPVTVIAPVPSPVAALPVDQKTSPVSHPRRSHRPPGPHAHKAAMPKKSIVHKKIAMSAAPPGTPPALAPLPGLAAAPEKSSVPSVISPIDSSVPVSQRKSDPWAERQNEAIKLAMAKTLPGGKITVGGQAQTMLRQMHEKELMHAAETGERLYLPDKMAWVALQEDGARYRVYLNFQAMQANGERVQTRSYQFNADLSSRTILAEDSPTQQDLLTQNAELNFTHNPIATDIDAILGGVDTYNKHKVQMIIIKKNRSNRDERTNIETALKAAQSRIQRSIVYFRRTYTDKALQNVAKAYNFLELLKG